jgi:hypothetical protein
MTNEIMKWKMFKIVELEFNFMQFNDYITWREVAL